MSFYVYIMANKKNGTLYVGSTDEVHEERETAFRRERQIKEWQRAWKLRLIEELNPNWVDLNETLNC